jgi:hypothetical protein
MRHMDDPWGDTGVDGGGSVLRVLPADRRARDTLSDNAWITRDLDAMTPREPKTLETRLRRKAERMGYRLQKSRARDPDALTFGGYQIVDPTHGGLMAGWRYAGDRWGYGMDLNDVEAWLHDSE